MRELIERLEEKKRSLKDILNSLHVTIRQMETDPSFGKAKDVDSDKYSMNIKGAIKELSGLSGVELKGAIKRLKDAERDIGGVMSSKDFAKIIKKLKIAEKLVKYQGMHE